MEPYQPISKNFMEKERSQFLLGLTTLNAEYYFNFTIRKKKKEKETNLLKQPWNPKTLFIFLTLISLCSRLIRGCEQMLVISALSCL